MVSLGSQLAALAFPERIHLLTGSLEMFCPLPWNQVLQFLGHLDLSKPAVPTQTRLQGKQLHLSILNAKPNEM